LTLAAVRPAERGRRLCATLAGNPMAGQACSICSVPINPGERVSFQDGELLHMTCYYERLKAVRRGREIAYKGHTVRVFCYPLLGQWRPLATVESPLERGTPTRLGRMKLCNSVEEALALASKTAAD
jgi:hypothetical protein